MIIPGKYDANEIAIFKIVKITEAQSKLVEETHEFGIQSMTQHPPLNQTKLTILGLGPNNDILFSYTNPSQGVAQTFGINLKYYRGHQQNHFNDKGQIIQRNMTEFDRMMETDSEGVYTFKTEFNKTDAYLYSNIDQDGVTYQKGMYMEQYTLQFEKRMIVTPTSGLVNTQQVIVRVQFSPLMFNEIIKFDVDMNTIQIDDHLNKDLTVNWKFYDNFDSKGEFWTDSNGL